MWLNKDEIRDKKVTSKYTNNAAVKEVKTWKRPTENEYQHLNNKKPCYDKIFYGLDIE